MMSVSHVARERQWFPARRDEVVKRWTTQPATEEGNE